MTRKEIALLLLLTFAALFVHGYHPAAEDAEIYVPSIIKIVHPSYYPFGQQFFEANAHLTLFPYLIAEIARFTHAPIAWLLFCGYLASVFLLLLACLRLATKCFPSSAGRWSAVTLAACLLTLPVAGTSLYIFDQYLNPRSISAFAIIFAIDAALERKYWRTMLWLVLTTVIHPFMTIFGVVFIALWFVRHREASRVPATAATCAVFFGGFIFRSPSSVYWQCLQDHRYYFLLRWTWYEWLGIIAPLAILWWCKKNAYRHGHSLLGRLASTTLIFELACFAAGLIITIPHQFEIVAPYQPMRSLQLVYLLMFMFIGGLLGEYVLQSRWLRWALLFIPVAASLCIAQIRLFPATRHVEWPGAASKNPWLQAFAWTRENTPQNAVFALDPNYMALPEENYQGFRAVAERSRLADDKKDWSDAVLYPWLPLADDVLAQTQAVTGWKRFGPADFARLKRTYHVTWVVLQQPGPAGLSCPYHNALVSVCQIE